MKIIFIGKGEMQLETGIVCDIRQLKRKWNVHCLYNVLISLRYAIYNCKKRELVIWRQQMLQ